MYLLTSVQILAALGEVFCLFMFWRNNQVYKFRIWMIDEISKQVNKDILASRDWLWRRGYRDQVSYNAMFWQFWKPLKPEAWYTDTSFLKSSDPLESADKSLNTTT